MDATAIIIGGGPAGLTAAYQLSKSGRRVVVLEADPMYVGGISRTIEYKGFRFDIGGHRFFSKSREVEDLWTEILGEDMLVRRRLSRIYYRRRFFAYPIRPLNVARNLGLAESALCLLSYVKARLFPFRPARSVEEWVTNEFGERLYKIFFKTYTEKVWGMSCRDISADWAAQRIKGLSLGTAIRNGLLRFWRRPGTSIGVKSLIESFRYPRLGPGMMWEKCRDLIRANGGEVLMGQRAVACRYTGDAQWEVTAVAADGARSTFTAAHVISSAPMRELVPMVQPALSSDTLAAARALKYRDFLTVALILKERQHLPDTWIYVHDPALRVGRLQVFKSWSEALVPDPALCCYGLEYFCFEGDGLWTAPDSELIALATRELAQLGLAAEAEVIDGTVVRQKKAYPVYDAAYASHVRVVREAIAANSPGLHLVGRNGMHKYDNQDHAMMTALLTARNIMAGECLYDVWRVNQDAEYVEDGPGEGATGERLVPRPVSAKVSA